MALAVTVVSDNGLPVTLVSNNGSDINAAGAIGVFANAASGGAAAALLASFQAAIDALPATGGLVLVPPGTYSNLTPGSLSVGSKAVVWVAHGTTLPANMPGAVLTDGVVSLPESSIQSNRDARIYNYTNLGNITFITGKREYAYNVTGFVQHVAGNPSELEARAYSFDLGTNQDDSVDAVRGLKGRVYGTAGKANLRAIYGFAESTSGGTHTGELTGVLGTIYRNGALNTNGDSVAIRGHVDSGCSAAFQAAGSAASQTPSFGYTCRTGTGNPLLPITACYQAHGGGAGDMYIGYLSNTDTTVTYNVNKNANVKAVGGYYSNTASVADDTAVAIVPPQTTGILRIFAEATDQAWATVFFRSSGTALCRAAGTNGTSVTLTTITVLAGTTGTDLTLNLSVVSSGGNGTVYVENRLGATKQITWEFCSRG